NEQLSYIERANSIIALKENGRKKGAVSERILQELLFSTFPSADVTDMTSVGHSGDFVLTRVNKPKILIENKEYAADTTYKQVQKFELDCRSTHMHGIMLSQASGIALKENYQFDIDMDKNILVYVHYVNMDGDKIKLAVSLIDRLHSFY